MKRFEASMYPDKTGAYAVIDNKLKKVDGLFASYREAAEFAAEMEENYREAVSYGQVLA